MASQHSEDWINRYAQWINSEIDSQSEYHNHKEKMAWTATALYLPAIIGGSFLVKGMIASVAMSLLIPVAASMFLLFLHTQFSLRWIAADRTEGLMRAMAKFLSAPESFSLDELGNNIPDQEGKLRWPCFIQKEIDKCQIKRVHKAAINDFAAFRWNKLAYRWRTELPSYVIVIGASVVALIILWTK